MVVVEELGRSIAAGPYLPCVIAGAVIAGAGSAELKQRLLPGLADGSTLAGVALDSELEVRDGKLHGSAEAVVGGGLAGVLVLPVGDDVAIVDVSDPGITLIALKNLDPGRRAVRLTADGAAADVIPGARRLLTDVGPARSSPPRRSAWRRRASRWRVSTPVPASSSAGSSPCSRRSSTTAPTWPSPPSSPPRAVWDAGRASRRRRRRVHLRGRRRRGTRAAAADLNAKLNTQVHGGIGFTWEHDAHLFLRRATALEALVDGEAAAAEIVGLYRGGIRPTRSVELPPEAEGIRDEVKQLVAQVKDLDEATSRRRTALVDTGYAVPSWPKPWGRDAGPDRAARHRGGVSRRRHQASELQHHRLGHPHPDPARHRGSGRPLGAARARPGSHLVPAVQRARGRLRRGRRQDPRASRSTAAG